MWETSEPTYSWEDAGFQVLMPTREYQTFDDDPTGEYEVSIDVEEQITGEQYADSAEATFELA